jgi:hypothetical protein
MVVVPLPVPVTIPAPDTVPTAGAPLVHTPPRTASARAVVCPTHTTGVPVIGANGFTTRDVTVLQPVATIVYVRISVPEATPVAIPDVEPIVAIAGILLLHMPPATVSVNAAVWPIHTAGGPVISDGPVDTFTVCVTLHPELME